MLKVHHGLGADTERTNPRSCFPRAINKRTCAHLRQKDCRRRQKGCGEPLERAGYGGRWSGGTLGEMDTAEAVDGHHRDLGKRLLIKGKQSKEAKSETSVSCAGSIISTKSTLVFRSLYVNRI